MAAKDIKYGQDARGAILKGASLISVDLSLADLVGTDLSGAQLDGTALDGIRHDESTIWPDGFTPPTSLCSVYIASRR